MNHSDQESNDGVQGQKSQQELLLEKINTILEKTDPESWKKGGYPVDPEERFEKPRKTWEELYTLDIPAGTLVLRCSTPVKSEFVGRGFGLVPIAPPNFTTEIRASGWHFTELTDPYKRSRLSDRSCTVLAEGQIAEELYLKVDDSYLNHFADIQDAFDNESYDFISRLPGRLKDETLSDWDRKEDTPGEVYYHGIVDDLEVEVGHLYIDGREQFSCTVTRDKTESEITDYGLIKELYIAIEEVGQTSRLATLSKALEQL